VDGSRSRAVESISWPAPLRRLHNFSMLSLHLVSWAAGWPPRLEARRMVVK
jgi:hypothetical protein